MAKVSVVLPTHNGERYLRQSVDSILAQTYTDWELILVDDCSDDGTAYIAEEYAASDSRIRVIHNKENKKLPKALNIGFSAATGRYLTWTSDDNLYEKTALEVMAGYLDLHDDTYMVRTGMKYIDEEGNGTGQSGRYSGEKMYVNNCVGACFMYRREVREIIGDYDEDAFCVEDYDYWLRVLSRFGKIASIEKTLYQYRRHGRSLSALRKKQVSDQLTKMRIRYADEIFEALQEKPEMLCHIFYEMRKSRYMTDEMAERFLRRIPALKGEVPLAGDGNCIIFGAGAWGEKAAAKLGRRTAFFADSDPQKAGKIKCGFKILSFGEAVKLAGEYQFVIAAAGMERYEMAIQLWAANIKEYSLFAPEEKADEEVPLWT